MDFGTHDFIEYWSAYSVLVAGGNPYDPQAMLAVQQGLGSNVSSPLMMWLPPWALLLLFPILPFDFQDSATIWLLCNVFFAIGAGTLSVAAFSSSKVHIISGAIAGIVFMPTIMCMELGQISLFLAFGTSLLLWSLEKKSAPLVGLSLCLLGLKPHLFLLIFLFVVWNCIQEGWFQPLIFAGSYTDRIGSWDVHSLERVYLLLDSKFRGRATRCRSQSVVDILKLSGSDPLGFSRFEYAISALADGSNTRNYCDTLHVFPDAKTPKD